MEAAEVCACSCPAAAIAMLLYGVALLFFLIIGSAYVITRE